MSSKNAQRVPAGPDRAALEATIDKLDRYARELRNFDVGSVQERTDHRMDGLHKRINGALQEALGQGTAEYKQHALPAFGSALDTSFGDHYSLDEWRDNLRKEMNQGAGKLGDAKQLLEQRLQAPAAPASASVPAPLPPRPPPPAPAAKATAPPSPSSPGPTAMPTPAPAAQTSGGRVALLAAGGTQDDAVADFLGHLGLQPLKVAATSSADAAAIAQLQTLRDTSFAVLLPGPGGIPLLELGFLLALHPAARLCMLLPASTESAVPPGVTSLPLDDGGLWRLLLARQMRHAGLEVDLNRAI